MDAFVQRLDATELPGWARLAGSKMKGNLMSSRWVASVSLFVFVGLVRGIFVLGGCQKEKPPAQQPAKQGEEAATQEHVAAVQPGAGEQTTCPVMGNPIDKSVFIEYQGKKVYFCCKACPDVFKADPAKYIAKLPQFAK